MLYPSDIEKKIGFDKIREITASFCLTRAAKELAEVSGFSDDFGEVKHQLSFTWEFLNIIRQDLAFPSYDYFDVHPILEKALPEGAFLTAEEFHDLKQGLKTFSGCLAFFDKHKDQFPALSGLATGKEADGNLLKEIERVVDDSGKVKDTASQELNVIRYNLHNAARKLRTTIEKILRHSISSGYTEEEQQFTVRSGRMVIPVKAEFKRTIKGFIHDESASGQTVFIEPAEVLEANNELRDLELAERREVIRILTRLTGLLRPQIFSLLSGFDLLSLYDFFKARARLANQLKCTLPYLHKGPCIDWRSAFHPLLFIYHSAQGKKTVPFSLKLDQNSRLLIISGPNAGGKSVTLKAVALLQYMLQCGYLIPVAEDSSSGIFRDIFIDIGDEQSIENDLSTYSSHLRNLKHFLFHARNSSLVFIDEFGSGTEPQAGGAIAETILEELNSAGVFGVITTHFANLKKMGSEVTGLLNGAMLYDRKNLEPLFELETGRAGSSYAFEIAEKAGLPLPVIERAKDRTGESQVSFEELTRKLEEEKQKLKIRSSETEKLAAELELLKEELSSRREYLDTYKKELMREAKLSARALLDEANQKIERVIREIKEAGAEKERTKDLRKDLEMFRKKVTVPPEVSQEEEQTEAGDIKAGDFVQISGQDAAGEVSEIRGKEAEILIGNLKTRINMSKLRKISRKTFKKLQSGLGSSVSYTIDRKLESFRPDLDIRGKRGEEAVKEVRSMMDNALVLGVSELRIIHGKGNGILRSLIREHLKEYSQVISVTDEHADRGGAGVTIVRLQ